MASADFLLQLSSSPFQAQGKISPGKNTILHRTTAGFTLSTLDHKSFAAFCQLALVDYALYPILVHRLTVSLLTSSPCWAHKKGAPKGTPSPRVSRSASNQPRISLGIHASMASRVFLSRVFRTSASFTAACNVFTSAAFLSCLCSLTHAAPNNSRPIFSRQSILTRLKYVASVGRHSEAISTRRRETKAAVVVFFCFGASASMHCATAKATKNDFSRGFSPQNASNRLSAGLMLAHSNESFSRALTSI